MPVTKKWYTSKTIWINAIALGVVIANEALEWNISAEIQGVALVFINAILRFITKEEIVW